MPADPARLLAATYGAAWRTPDPAFHFETPSSTHRRLNGWFRGIRVDRPLWDRVYRVRPTPESWEPSDLARDAFAAHGADASYVDLGCGHGADARWLGEQGATAWGLDHVPEAVPGSRRGDGRAPAGRATSTSTSWRCARCCRPGRWSPAGPRRGSCSAGTWSTAWSARGRVNLYRLAGMLLREGGELRLEFLSRRGNDGYAGRHHLRARRPDRIAAELERAGATIRDRSVLLASGPVSGREADVVPSRICRMVVSWDR